MSAPPSMVRIFGTPSLPTAMTASGSRVIAPAAPVAPESPMACSRRPPPLRFPAPSMIRSWCTGTMVASPSL